MLRRLLATRHPLTVNHDAGRLDLVRSLGPWGLTALGIGEVVESDLGGRFGGLRGVCVEGRVVEQGARVGHRLVEEGREEVVGEVVVSRDVAARVGGGVLLVGGMSR